MNYQNVVKDFARRTQQNLAAIDRILSEETDYDVYEVTQLINSMLGLLIFPQQRYINSIPKIPLSELTKQGWPTLKMQGVGPGAITLRELVRYMRNAVSHFNIEFIANHYHQIEGVRLWNIFPRTQEKTWEAELSIKDLREITNRFIELLLDDGRRNTKNIKKSV